MNETHTHEIGTCVTKGAKGAHAWMHRRAGVDSWVGKVVALLTYDTNFFGFSRLLNESHC